MPKQPNLKIDGESINGILDVEYSVGKGWDPHTGIGKAARRYGVVVVTKEMEESSASLFRKGCLPNETFDVEISFVRNDPATHQDEEYLWIDLKKAIIVEYMIHHQDWKNTGLENYNAVEVFHLGYDEITIRTKDAEHVEKFIPADKQ